MDPSKPKEELIKEIESTFFDEHSEKSFDAMMKEKKFDKVVQFLGVFSRELEAISQNIELEDVVNDYKMKMFDILDKVRSCIEHNVIKRANVTSFLDSTRYQRSYNTSI